MLKEKDYCDKDTCVALAKLGFPRWELPYEILSQKYRLRLDDAQKWLREEKDILIVVHPYTYNVVNKTHTWTCEIWFGDNLEYEIHDLKSYEEALSEGIKEAVKILKDEEAN